MRTAIYAARDIKIYILLKGAKYMYSLRAEKPILPWIVGLKSCA
jgi:hypothetical protein